jgi:hypothetical protein
MLHPLSVDTIFCSAWDLAFCILLQVLDSHVDAFRSRSVVCHVQGIERQTVVVIKAARLGNPKSDNRA